MSGFSAGSITFTCQGFTEAFDAALQEDVQAVRRAARSAINKVSRSVKSMTSAEIRKLYNVPKSVLDDRMSMIEAKVNELVATLTVGGKSVSLSYFGARQFAGAKVITRKGVTARKRVSKFQGVSVEVERGKRTQLKSAFMQRFKSGHVGILRRVGKGRYPVAVKSAISLASMFDKVDVRAEVVRKVEADLERVFWHELEFYLGRSGR